MYSALKFSALRREQASSAVDDQNVKTVSQIARIDLASPDEVEVPSERIDIVQRNTTLRKMTGARIYKNFIFVTGRLAVQNDRHSLVARSLHPASETWLAK
jgi:hypothetical protein